MLPPAAANSQLQVPSSEVPTIQHIDPARMLQAMDQHRWLGCDIVLTDAGFHQIHDALAGDTGLNFRFVASVGSGTARPLCAGVHTPVV